MRNSTAWNLHMLAGLVLVLLLGVHMITTHLDLILHWFNPAGGKAIEYANVAARGQHFSTVIFYVLFLGLALYHGLYGLRTILFELNPGKQMESTITKVFVIGGIVLFAIGSIATLIFKFVA